MDRAVSHAISAAATVLIRQLVAVRHVAMEPIGC